MIILVKLNLDLHVNKKSDLQFKAGVLNLGIAIHLFVANFFKVFFCRQKCFLKMLLMKQICVVCLLNGIKILFYSQYNIFRYVAIFFKLKCVAV